MIYIEQNEETLVALTLAGNQKAYEALVLRWQRAVVVAAYSVTRNHYMAEDAAQDAFVNAWIKLNTLHEPQKYGAWVCRISKNCAKNMMVRFREHASFDVIENTDYERNENIEDLLISSEDDALLHDSIGKLSEKVRKVIYLHYFHGLSIAEIADKLRIPTGTVKSQLHSGRKKISKNLCAANGKENDTFVQKVMKKVEELKLWKLKRNKDGFATAYADVLQDAESLLESEEKQNAMADILMRGRWWLPGEKNEALLARIKEAAEIGKNDDVMEFIVGLEDKKLSGKSQIEFMRDKQIPRLEAKGFVKTLGCEWFWLGHKYFRSGDTKSGFEAYDKVLSILNPSDVYYANVLSAIKLEKVFIEKYKDTDRRKYSLHAIGEEYRFIAGKLRFWSQPGYWIGEHYTLKTPANYVMYNATRCDGYFFDEYMKPDDSITGSDGATLTYSKDSVTVQTPAGIFEGCRLWITKSNNHVYKTYYKQDVGIVKQETFKDSHIGSVFLKSYYIAGGKGLLPCFLGNKWVYATEDHHEYFNVEIGYEMIHADQKNVTVSCYEYSEQIKYDINSWDVMMELMTRDYVTSNDKGEHILKDVSYQMERTEALAKTPIQTVHTKAACSVMRRIFNTDPIFNPGCTEKGHWNFFLRSNVNSTDGKITLTSTSHFEWKDMKSIEDAGLPMLFNDIYGMLKDATGCIWSDEWTPGTEKEYTQEYYGKQMETMLRCENAGTVRTTAGVFENCICIHLDIKGLTGGFAYRGGTKEYYIAQGIGIVRHVSYFKNNTLSAAYELMEYIGTAEGYMPVGDGMLRKYEAINLKEGFVGAAEYTTCADKNGDIVIFENRTGIKKL